MGGKKKQFSVRLPSDTAEKLERYCEERDLSYADALRRFAEKELLREQMERDIVQTDGGLTRSENPWIDPLEKLGWAFMFAGIFATIAAGSVAFSHWLYGVEIPALVFVPLITFAVVSDLFGFAVIGALEYLTHPYEAPIRQYFRRPQVGV